MTNNRDEPANKRDTINPESWTGNLAATQTAMELRAEQKTLRRWGIAAGILSVCVLAIPILVRNDLIQWIAFGAFGVLLFFAAATLKPLKWINRELKRRGEK